MDIQTFIKPELLVLIPVLYFVGCGIKKSGVKDKWIPLILGAVGVGLSCIWVIATSGYEIMGIFTAVTQGILCAGASVYANQIIKQSDKME